MTEFQKILKYLFFLLFALGFFYTKVSASDLVFPFPQGSVYVINGYNESDSHQKKSLYSLDFRSYEGNDQCDSYGSPILASEGGQIIFLKNETDKGKDKGYGTHVVIKTGAGEKIWYAHMIYGSIFVHGPTDANKNLIGDIVQKGQILGLLGDTGFALGMKCNVQGRKSIGHHLHFEMRDQDGKAFKPEPMHGEKSYTNLSKAGNPYISTTMMIDPGKFWDQWKHKVPYKLSYTPIKVDGKEETMSSNKIGVNKEGVLARFWKFIFSSVSRKKTWTNEEALAYVKKANGEYSDEFLDWVGWKRESKIFEHDQKYMMRLSLGEPKKIKKIVNKNSDATVAIPFGRPNELIDALFGYQPISISLPPYRVHGPQGTSWNMLDFISFRDDLLNIHSEYDLKIAKFLHLLHYTGEKGQDFLHLNTPPDDLLISTAKEVGLRYVDESYKFFYGNTYAANYMIDLETCPISQQTKSRIQELANPEHYSGIMEKIWNSHLPPTIKFYVQTYLDESYRHAISFKDVLKENYFDCIGFFGEMYYLLEEPYLKLEFQKLQSIFDDFLKK